MKPTHHTTSGQGVIIGNLFQKSTSYMTATSFSACCTRTCIDWLIDNCLLWFMYSIVFYITFVVLSCVLSAHNKRILYCIVAIGLSDPDFLNKSNNLTIMTFTRWDFNLWYLDTECLKYITCKHCTQFERNPISRGWVIDNLEEIFGVVVSHCHRFDSGSSCRWWVLIHDATSTQTDSVKCAWSPWLLTRWKISALYSKNKIGPNIEPCGTPYRTVDTVLVVVNRTCCTRPCRFLLPWTSIRGKTGDTWMVNCHFSIIWFRRTFAKNI